jgi:hypothetical protein
MGTMGDFYQELAERTKPKFEEHTTRLDMVLDYWILLVRSLQQGRDKLNAAWDKKIISIPHDNGNPAAQIGNQIAVEAAITEKDKHSEILAFNPQKAEITWTESHTAEDIDAPARTVKIGVLQGEAYGELDGEKLTANSLAERVFATLCDVA